MSVVVSGDLLRPDNNGNPHQLGNIIWVYENVKQSIPEATVIIPEKCASFNDWYLTDQETEEKSILYSKININDIVIGFELPVNSITEFNKEGIKYIDINVYPIRFLEKRVLGIKSNFIDFSKIKVLENEFYEGSKKYLGYSDLDSFSLLIGQTRIDRSLLNNCKLLKMEDFIYEFKDIPNLFYLPHPLDLDNNINLMNSIGINVLRDRNIYKLLSTSTIKCVLGISSSVLYESRYFNVPSKFLCERTYNTNLIPVYEDVFWKYLTNLN